MKIEAVVFDMDGLMIDSERVIQYSWGVAGRKMGYANLEEDIYHTLGLNRDSREQYFIGKYGEDFPFTRFLEEYRREYARYADLHGIPAKKGLYELLELLKKHHIPMAVATSSSRENSRRNLQGLGVTGYFDAYICGDMVTCSKPDPEIYLKACAALNTSPATALALEDSINGVLSAHAAEMLPVMVPDLVKDTSEVDMLLVAKKRDLLEVAEWLEESLKI